MLTLRRLRAFRRLFLVTSMKEDDESPNLGSNSPPCLDALFPPSYRHLTLRTLKSMDAFLYQNPRLIAILSNLHELTTLAQILDGNSQGMQYEQAVERWETVKWDTLYSRWSEPDDDYSSKQSQDRLILEACRIASIIFISMADPTILYTTAPPDVWQPDQYLTDLILALHYSICGTDRSGFWAPLPGALIWCLVIGSVASTRLGEAYATTRSWFRVELLKATVAFWFARGDPGQTVAESFDMIVRGVKSASNLNGNCQTTKHIDNVPSSWAERPRLMVDQF